MSYSAFRATGTDVGLDRIEKMHLGNEKEIAREIEYAADFLLSSVADMEHFGHDMGFFCQRLHRACALEDRYKKVCNPAYEETVTEAVEMAAIIARISNYLSSAVRSLWEQMNKRAKENNEHPQTWYVDKKSGKMMHIGLLKSSVRYASMEPIVNMCDEIDMVYSEMMTDVKKHMVEEMQKFDDEMNKS